MSWKYIDTSILQDVALFSTLSQRALQEILVIMTTMQVKQGIPIFEEGQEGNSLYLILAGEIRISKLIPGVGEEALAFLPKGSCFGEMALIENHSIRSASAIAHRDTELIKLSRQDFLELCERERELAMELLWQFVRILSQRLRNSNDKVTFMALSSKFE